MLYIVAAILILAPLVLLKLKLDDDLYRFLKVILFKSDTIKKIKRKVVVIFSLLYAALAITILYNINPEKSITSDSEPNAPVVIEVFDTDKDNITISVPNDSKDNAGSIGKGDIKNIEFASLMMDMDKYILENAIPLSRNISTIDADTLQSMMSAYIALVDNKTETFRSRFDSLGNITDSERSAFTQKLKIIKSDKDKQLSDIEKVLKSKSDYPDILFNYFVFESRDECLEVIAKGKVSSWVGLDCNSSNQFAFIFSKTKDKTTSSIVRLKADLKSCESGKCLTQEMKSVSKGFVSASKSYLEIQNIFGQSLKSLTSNTGGLSTLNEESDKLSVSNKATLQPVTTNELITPSREHKDDTKDAVKWLSFKSKNNITNINMVVFREFSHCEQFKDRLAEKLKKELDCNSNQNIKTMKINGEIHKISGFTYVYKRRSLEYIESFPIFKSESGSYVYPNGVHADKTGLHVGTVPKDTASKFMAKQ